MAVLKDAVSLKEKGYATMAKSTVVPFELPSEFSPDPGQVRRCAGKLNPRCPMTIKIKGYPFEVLILGSPSSVVLSDQVKSLDWKVRAAKRKGKVAAQELDEVSAKSTALIYG